MYIHCRHVFINLCNIWPSGGHLEKSGHFIKEMIDPISNINQYKKLYLHAKCNAFCSKRTIISRNYYNNMTVWRPSWKSGHFIKKNWLAPYPILISTKNCTSMQNFMLFAQNAQLFHEVAGLRGLCPDRDWCCVNSARAVRALSPREHALLVLLYRIIDQKWAQSWPVIGTSVTMPNCPS